MQAASRFESVNIDKLIPYARNARSHSKEQILQLRSSLREFGFVNPALIDKDYNIIAGHGRVLAAKAEGLTEIPCVFVEHLTDAQKKAYILADNRLALSAGWDDQLLALEMADLKDLGFDLELTGFDANEIEKLFTGNDNDVHDDDFDLSAALEKAAFVLPGDAWTVGRHRLVCGDATDADTVRKLMAGRKKIKKRNCTKSHYFNRFRILAHILTGSQSGNCDGSRWNCVCSSGWLFAYQSSWYVWENKIRNC